MPATEASEEAASCNKDSGFCPTRTCSSNSVLCIDASNRTNDDEFSYRALTDPSNAGSASMLFEAAFDSDKRSPLEHNGHYVFVQVKNNFEDGNIIGSCAGRKTGAFTIANIAIDYKGLKGSSTVTFVPLSVMFVQANSVDILGKGSSVNGCTFKSASHQTGPYLLYSGPGDDQQDYTLHFKTTAGVVPPATHFAMFAKVATQAAAVWPGFIALTTPASALINTVAADLDQLSQEAAVTSNIEYSAVLTTNKRGQVDAGQRLQVWSPRLGEKRKAGYIEFAQGRSASMVMDANAQHDWITPQDVLAVSGLGSPHRCIPGTGACDREQTFIRALNSDFDLYGDFQSARSTSRQSDNNSNDDSSRPSRGSSNSGRVRSGAENWDTVFQTCEKIRTVASDLGLTEIDSLLVRWALLQRAKLIDVLRDYQSGKLTDGVANGLKGAARVGVEDPSKQCWDAAVDDKRMHAVEALIGKARFSPAIP